MFLKEVSVQPTADYKHGVQQQNSPFHRSCAMPKTQREHIEKMYK